MRADRIAYIQRPTQTTDATGRPVSTWSAVATIWLRRKTNREIESFEDRQERGSKTIEFETPRMISITVHDRLLIDSVVYDILNISEIGRRRGLNITAEARTS